jgi:hypothetical protein
VAPAHWCIPAAAHNFTGLLVGRILLGGFEATILPAFILIVGLRVAVQFGRLSWFQARCGGRAGSSHTVPSPISLPTVSPVSLGPSWHTESAMRLSSIHAYQAVFLSLGAISIGIQPLVWFMLPNSPATAKFLRHGNDRLIAVERLRENNTGTKVSTISVGPGWLDLGRPQSGNGTNSGRRCAT